MKENILRFKNDIKVQVQKQKADGYCYWWMHPVYCAYYILKHNQLANAEEIINNDIKLSYKALPDDWLKMKFKQTVKEYLKLYEETICTD